MPDRLKRNSAFGFVVIGLLGVIFVALFWLALATAGFDRAIDGLRTSSSRSECRSAIVNEDEDVFRHAIGDLFAASQARDFPKVTEIVNAIRVRVKTQDRIDKICPAPLVSHSNHPLKETP